MAAEGAADSLDQVDIVVYLKHAYQRVNNLPAHQELMQFLVEHQQLEVIYHVENDLLHERLIPVLIVLSEKNIYFVQDCCKVRCLCVDLLARNLLSKQHHYFQEVEEAQVLLVCVLICLQDEVEYPLYVLGLVQDVLEAM